MAKVICLASKGGTGKTTSALNLAAALAEKKKKVLLVDLDPHFFLSLGVGVEIKALKKSVYNALLEEGIPVNEVIQKTKIPGVDILPATRDLSGAERELARIQISPESFLKDLLEEIKDRYDFIIIDTPPSTGYLTINALVASDLVIIPIQCEYYPMAGIEEILDTVSLVKKRPNPNLEIAILGTMYDERTVLHKEVIENLRKIFGDKVYKTIIQRSIKVAEAPMYKISILEYASKNPAAEAYRKLAKEVLNGR